MLRVIDLVLALGLASVPAVLTFAEVLPTWTGGIVPTRHLENVPAAVRTFGHVFGLAAVPSVVFGVLYGLA